MQHFEEIQYMKLMKSGHEIDHEHIKIKEKAI